MSDVIPRPTPLPVRPDPIPEVMKVERRWVAWNYVWIIEPGKPGRWTKPPFIATAPDQKADVTDPTIFRSFDEALGAYEDGKCDGIGFGLGGGWCAFDGDHCDGHPYVQMLNSYSERSPSGDGVHVIVKGVKPGSRCRTGLYELYEHGRYMTVTGHHLEDTPTTVEERTAEIALVYATLFSNGHGAALPRPSTSTTRGAAIDDDLILAKATTATDGALFLRLWRGDSTLWTGASKAYDSHSEADLALVLRLARITRDPVQLDRLFRRSALMREKWDRTNTLTINSALAKSQPDDAPADAQAQVTLVCASEVPVEKLNWLYRARLARGAISLFEGAAEKGKSTVLCDLAARVSTGESFPGETETRAPANVVMLIAEDDLGATVVPRLIAAQADRTRIFFLTATKDAHGELVPFHLTDDCERLRVKCVEIGHVALVAVDPLVSFLGSRTGRTVNTNNDLEVRKALGPLKDLAESLRTSVVAIRHYKKDPGTDALAAGGGSVGFGALVRVQLAALPDPDTPGLYYFAVAKNNLVKPSERPALMYQIVPSAADPDIGCVAWGRAVEISANEILAAQAEANKYNKGKVAEAQTFLEKFLASGEWVATKEIYAAAEAHGIKKSAVDRAKGQLELDVEKRGKVWGWKLILSEVPTLPTLP